MKKDTLCAPEKHRMILDPKRAEYSCSVCGVVDEEMSRDYRSTVNAMQERQSSTEDHMPVMKFLLVSLGTQHHYVSPNNPGLGFKLANPFGGLKDFEGKSCRPVLAPYVGYNTGNGIGRRGAFANDGHFMSNYEADFFMHKGSQNIHDMCKALNLDILTAQRMASDILKFYSDTIIEIMTVLGPVLAVFMNPSKRISVQDREHLKTAAIRLITDLSKVCRERFDKGMKILDDINELGEENVLQRHNPVAIPGVEEPEPDSSDIGKI